MAPFVCDAMLGELARWLRILGFPAVYIVNTWSDNEVLELLARDAGPGPQVLLTRDKRLHERAARAGHASVHLAMDTPTEEALRRALDAAGVPPVEERLFTLCSLCNGTLREATQEEIATVPERVAARQEEFRACSDCGQVYWKGTHWEGIRRMFEALGGVAGGGARRPASGEKGK